MVQDLLWVAGGLVLLFGALNVVVLSLTWVERKVLGRIQRRMGPMRVGFHGTLQPFADALKLVTKEDVIPGWADKPVFWLAPLVFFVPAFMIWLTIPFASDMVVRNLEMGLLYLIAFSVLSIVGLIMAGWGSANKYAILGGLRAGAQLISYEIPIIMVVIAVAMLPAATDPARTGSLNLVTIVGDQRVVPYAALQPLGLLLFLVAGVAELGRTPFDIFQAESEVVGGPFVEYSGAHWAVFFLAEYVNVFAVGMLVALLFLGGWTWPALPQSPAIGVAVVLLKAYAVIMVIFWLRGTFPRLRVDQLMALAWKVIIPLTFANLIITGIYLFYGWPAWTLTAMSLGVTVGVGYGLFRRMAAPAREATKAVADQARPREEARAG